jgi:hypothetical protein
MKTAFSFLFVFCFLLPYSSTQAAQKHKPLKAKTVIKESWSHDDLMAYLKDHPEKMDLEAVSTIRAQNSNFSEADKMLLYAKYLNGLRGGSFHHYYHFWTFFHSDVSKSNQAEMAAEIIREKTKNFNEHSREIDFDSCSYFLPYLIDGAKEWYLPGTNRNATIDSARSMMLWGVVKLMERNTGWLFAHVGNFSFSKDLMAECDSFRHYSIPYLYDSNPELTAKMSKERTEHFMYSPAMNAQPLGAALNIYQLVLNYYSSDTSLRDRMVLADLMRLQFVNTSFSGPNSKTAWREAIQRLLVHNGTNSSSTLVAAQLATYLFRLSKENESPEQGSAASWYRFQAYHTAKQFSARFPDGLGSKACRMLMHEISQSDFSAEMDEQWYPNKPSLLKLKYKNMHHLYVYVFDLKNRQDTSQSPEPGTLLSLQQFELKDFGDFYEHRTQLMLQGLTSGKYYVELADTVLTYPDAARLATYIIVAPARITYYENANGKRMAKVVDINSGEALVKKFELQKSISCFPVDFRWKSKSIVVGGVSEISVAQSIDKSNTIIHSLPVPMLTLNKGAYAPGDVVECIAKANPKDFLNALHTGGYTVSLSNIGQEISVPDLMLEKNQHKLFWYNEDHQFIVRFRLDSILRDGNYLLQIGDASVTIPVRNSFDQGTFIIKSPIKASFEERMHFTAQWKKGTKENYIPKNINVSIALLEYDFNKSNPSRHILDKVISLNKDGSFAFDFVPITNAKYDERFNTHNLSRYTFTWSFLDSLGQPQTQFNRYYIASPNVLLVSELPEKVEANQLVENRPVLKAIDGEGLVVSNFLVSAKIIRLRPPFIAPIISDFTPDYFTMPVDTFRAKFPYFAYAGETKLQNLSTRDTVFQTSSTNIELLSNQLFHSLQNGAYLLQIEPSDKLFKTTMEEHRFIYVNPKDNKTEVPEWLSISYNNGFPSIHCAKKAQILQCYFFTDKGVLKQTTLKSTAKWQKLKCPAGTRYIVVETYIAGKHIVRSWTYPEIDCLL